MHLVTSLGTQDAWAFSPAGKRTSRGARLAIDGVLEIRLIRVNVRYRFLCCIFETRNRPDDQ